MIRGGIVLQLRSYASMKVVLIAIGVERKSRLYVEFFVYKSLCIARKVCGHMCVIEGNCQQHLEKKKKHSGACKKKKRGERIEGKKKEREREREMTEKKREEMRERIEKKRERGERGKKKKKEKNIEKRA
jgi:CRISPR/Cas system CSM-associated protein Csm4 (group 5 of RAMP superfamily)